MCEEDALYQLNIPDLELVSSQQACQYAKQGLNETLTFFTNTQGSLISFGYEVRIIALFLTIFQGYRLPIHDSVGKERQEEKIDDYSWLDRIQDWC